MSLPFYLDDVDWKKLLDAGPGALWTLPDFSWETAWWTAEPAIPVPADVIALAESWDSMFASMLGAPSAVMSTAMRLTWLCIVGPRTCNCPMDPHHRWNCHTTPIWAQTMRDLDCNPWTAVDDPESEDRVVVHMRLVKRPFVWAGERGTYCTRGPCCLGDGHDGRCRL